MEWYSVEKLESESLIDEFEQIVGYKFPKSFRECVIKNNGGAPVFSAFDTETTEENEFGFLFSFNKKKDELTMWEALEACKIHLADAKIGGDIDEIAACEFILNRFVKFADAEGGDGIAFDKTDDSVVYIDHETLEIEKIADSFEELLDCLYEF